MKIIFTVISLLLIIFYFVITNKQSLQFISKEFPSISQDMAKDNIYGNTQGNIANSSFAVQQ